MEGKTSFMTGAIALIFLAIGYQTALFVHKAATLKLLSDRDRPDTVYVVDSSLAARLLSDPPSGALTSPLPPSGKSGSPVRIRKSSPYAAPAREAVSRFKTRKTESFPFNPNTVSLDDLQRLGFSEKQAEAIDRYRLKGGRFRKKEDFAKSYVVADSVYKRLEPFIRIPKIDLNRADSTALESLPGIGPYYVARILEYRERLGGFSRAEQLMELPRFDRDRFDGLRDLISVSRPAPFPLWTLSEDRLARHPYIGRDAARSIVLFRENTPKGQWSVEALRRNGILSEEAAGKLEQCAIAAP